MKLMQKVKCYIYMYSRCCLLKGQSENKGLHEHYIEESVYSIATSSEQIKEWW